MGWQEAKQRYQNLETLNDQKDEDLVARRVLSGLGIPVKKLHIVERRVFDDPQFDTAFWPRAKRVLEHALRIEHRELFNSWNIEVCESDHRHKEVLDRIDLVGDNKQPLMLTRFKGTTSSYAYSLWKPDEVYFMLPPFSIVSSVECGDSATYMWVVLQETEAFIKGLGLKKVFEEAFRSEES